MPRNEIFNIVYYRNIERQRKIFENRNFRQFRKALDSQVNEALDQPFSSIDVLRRNIESISSKPIKDAYIKAYTSTGVHFAGETVKEFNKNYLGGMVTKNDFADELYDVWAVKMTNYVNDIGSRIVDITGTTKEILQGVTDKVVNEAFDKGWDIERMGREIRKQAGITGRSRAVRIARTETINASNYGSLVGAESTNLPLDKVWLTTRDGKERDSHAQADGQKVDLKAKFQVGAARMTHPGDPAGGAQEVINCRCTIIYEPKGVEISDEAFIPPVE